MNRTMAIVAAFLAFLVACSNDVLPPSYSYTGGDVTVNVPGKGDTTMVYDDDPEIPRGLGAGRPEGWQTTGTLHDDGGASGEAVSLQADFPRSEIYTVQFAVPMTPQGPTKNGSFSAIAEVLWKVEGGLVRREISIGDGTSISAPAQGVEVSVHDASFLGAAPFVPYTVHIQVTRGVRASTASPPTRIPDFPFSGPISLTAGSSVTIPIPRNAGITSVEVTLGKFSAGAAPHNLLVEQVENFTSLKVYDPLDFPGFIAIKPGTTEIKLTNQGAFGQPTLSCSVLFGVDG